MALSRKARFYIIFFVGLFIVFYLVITRIIPGFGEIKLPVLSDVKPFSFTNQEGHNITEKDIRGKVYVAEYFFTTCRGICPRMNQNLQEVYARYRDEPDFRILSHTVDPETDSVPRMKRYADSLGVSARVWWFLTGTKDSLYHAARVSYLLDDPKNNNISIGEQFIHTQFFALVDRNGQVRKIVDGLKKEEISSLEEDIAALLREKVTNPRFANSLFTNNPN